MLESKAKANGIIKYKTYPEGKKVTALCLLVIPYIFFFYKITEETQKNIKIHYIHSKAVSGKDYGYY